MTITGWGAESEKGKQNPVLKKAVVYLISNEWCQNAYPDRIISKESKMCAVADNVDTCQGDSGGKSFANIVIKLDLSHWVLLDWILGLVNPECDIFLYPRDVKLELISNKFLSSLNLE